MPCGFGGATGSIEDVKLVIVTAEPGDPPDAAAYTGGPDSMLANSLHIFHAAMLNGSVLRGGRTAPFHRNMLRILKIFWPRDNLDEQLKKTWTTNAVLCPTPKSGGAHSSRVEDTCTRTYLAAQLAVFSGAFVFALGSKAKRRMTAAGLRVDAAGLHPSARASDAAKRESWEQASILFGLPNPVGEPRPNRITASESRRENFSRGVGPQPTSQQHPSNDPVSAAIAALPSDAAEFLKRLRSIKGYRCEVGRLQMMIYFDDEKVGGFNTVDHHWYISKLFVQRHGIIDLMKKNGFQLITHNVNHEFWRVRGAGAVSAFDGVLKEMDKQPILNFDR